MMTYYYKDGNAVKSITISAAEYLEENSRHKLFESPEDAKTAENGR